jgi:hypothetical protein
LVYPEKRAKDVYLQRYIERNSPPPFIELIDANWEKWINELRFEEYGCKQISMSSTVFLESELRHIMASEHGDVIE